MARKCSALCSRCSSYLRERSHRTCQNPPRSPLPDEFGWFSGLWRKVRGGTAAVPVPEPVSLFRDFCERPEPRTSAEVHHLLDLWEFEPGTEIAVFLVRPARLRWHKELPEAEW